MTVNIMVPFAVKGNRIRKVISLRTDKTPQSLIPSWLRRHLRKGHVECSPITRRRRCCGEGAGHCLALGGWSVSVKVRTVFTPPSGHLCHPFFFPPCHAESRLSLISFLSQLNLVRPWQWRRVSSILLRGSVGLRLALFKQTLRFLQNR